MRSFLVFASFCGVLFAVMRILGVLADKGTSNFLLTSQFLTNDVLILVVGCWAMTWGVVTEPEPPKPPSAPPSREAR